MRVIIILIMPILLEGCWAERTVVNSEHAFCAGTNDCYQIERIFYVRDRSFWEPGETVEELNDRAYRVVGVRKSELENPLAFCQDGSFCFETEVTLAICDNSLAIIGDTSVSDRVPHDGDDSICRRLELQK
jgi:hypothetical protein